MHSVLYSAADVLEPEVIQTIYRQRRQLELLSSNGRGFKVEAREYYVLLH